MNGLEHPPPMLSRGAACEARPAPFLPNPFFPIQSSKLLYMALASVFILCIFCYTLLLYLYAISQVSCVVMRNEFLQIIFLYLYLILKTPLSSDKLRVRFQYVLSSDEVNPVPIYIIIDKIRYIFYCNVRVYLLVKYKLLCVISPGRSSVLLCETRSKKSSIHKLPFCYINLCVYI